jgi:hypothetical protein
MDWMIRILIPGSSIIFSNPQTVAMGSGTHLLFNIGSSLEGKVAGECDNHSPPFNADMKNEWRYMSSPPFVAGTNTSMPFFTTAFHFNEECYYPPMQQVRSILLRS